MSLAFTQSGQRGFQHADPSLAKELLGWVAKRDLVNMCKTGYHWQSMNPNGYDA